MTNFQYYTLRKVGFNPLKIRKGFGKWEMLSYTNPHTGDERWSPIVGFTEEMIQEHIRLYGNQ